MTAGIPVELNEEHASSLGAWWVDRGSPRTVVYLDAHLDLQQTSPESLETLRRCRGESEIRALQSPHHLNPSARYAFGLENFLYPAARLGLLDRLVWVAPPHVPRRYSPQLLGFVQQMDGVEFEELSGFGATGRRALRGKLLGLDITICDFDDLDRLEVGEYDLDIDVDYFVEVPGDRPWVNPATVLNRIDAQLGPPRRATVSMATSSAFTPLDLRFLGDYLRALLTADESNRRRLAGLFVACQARADGRVEQAARLVQRSSRAEPGCAHSLFLLSRLESAPDRAATLRAEAAAIDPGYLPDTARDASAYPNRQLPLSSGALRALQDQIREQQDPGQRAIGELALAKLHAAAGDPPQAERLLSAQSGELANHDEIALDVARAYLARGEPAAARRWLEVAAGGYRTRTHAVMLLGDLALRGGDHRAALDLFLEVAARAPAWGLPLQRLRECHRLLGHAADADALSRTLERRRRVLEALSAASAASG